jgi:hypothetical protein
MEYVRLKSGVFQKPVIVGSPFRSGKRHEKSAVFKCLCGANFVSTTSSVKHNTVSSCGCLRRSLASKRLIGKSYTKTHGMSASPEYGVWSSMIKRCKDIDSKDRSTYFSRGITVCERWMCFDNFIEDMGKRPSESHSIDRENNNLGYSKENCRWATPKQQAFNKQSTVMVTVYGLTMSIGGWSDISGVPRDTIYARLHRKAKPEKWCVFAPVRQIRRA